MERYAAIAQSVERILGKDEVASSNLASSSIFPNTYAAIAQSVERILGKDEVASSNLASSSILPNAYAAIAQSVERILGKDEVASSNLASSSNPNRKVRVLLYPSGSEHLLATSSHARRADSIMRSKGFRETKFRGTG